jgi:photosystem II stability/assembly factor-like uncharacterized protein
MWFVLLLLLVATEGAWGQWRILAPVVVPRYSWGAMEYKDGIIWAGGTDLIYSPDTGKNWYTTNFTAGNIPYGGILDISFLDQNTGVVSTTWNGTFITHDRGQTWSSISSRGFYRITFARHSNVLYAVDDGGAFLISTDEGATWKQSNFGTASAAITFAEAIDGTIYVNASPGNAPGIGSAYLDISNDTGKTWFSQPPAFDADSYSIDVDSCDASRVYVSNEDFHWSGDGYSKIYTTANAGQTWTITFAHQIPYLVGSISNSGQALYVGTLNDGILRSVDNGNTWINIGGSGCSADCRQFAAINDNIIFALDSAGNIWSTFNSGGDSLNVSPLPSSFSVSSAALFASDTASCNSITRSVHFQKGNCNPPSVSGWSVIGEDALSYAVSHLTKDSISVTLLSSRQGQQRAQLVLSLDNGINDTVSLAGYVNLMPSVLSVIPDTAFRTDTIACDSLARTVVFKRSGCSPPSVSSYAIVGPDALNFRASQLSKDSIEITLYGVQQGNQNAQLLLYLDNDAIDTVYLAGFVNSSLFQLSLSTQDAQTDTLGGTVAIPLTIRGLDRQENVQMLLSYDGSVNYVGSFSPSGTKLDVPGEQSPGRSVLSIIGALPNTVTGYAYFDVFNDSNAASHATFDSVNVLTATSACEYSSPPPVTSTMTTLSGCSIPIISNAIHLGDLPEFSIVPNPTNGNVWLSSSQDVGDATIEIYDMLGVQQSAISTQIDKKNPKELLLPARSGVYTVMVTSINGTRSLRVVLEH